MSSDLIFNTPYSRLLLKNEVIVMEDSLSTQQIIKDVFEGEYHWHVTIVSSKEEVTQFLKQERVGFFVFDNWVGENKQEGLNALEQVRAIDKTVFVAIFSGYENYRQMAVRLGCNLFEEKSLNMRERVRRIVTSMLKYRIEILDNIKDETVDQLSASNVDPNIAKYEELKSDLCWFIENEGKYAAFVNGEWLKSSENDTDQSRKDLLKWLINERDFHEKERFFIKVSKDSNPMVIDEPSSFLFDDFSY